MNDRQEPTSHLEQMRVRLQRQQEFSLELTEVRFRDQIYSKGPEEKGFATQRRLEAVGTLSPYPNPLSVMIGDYPIEDVRVLVTILFMTDEFLQEASKTDRLIGDARSFDPSEKTLILRFGLPIQFRDRFTDSTLLPQIEVTLEGFSESDEEQRRCDPETQKFLGVLGCEVSDPSPTTLRARRFARERAKAREREEGAGGEQPDPIASFHKTVREFMAEVRRRVTIWEAAGVAMFITLVLVLVRHR